MRLQDIAIVTNTPLDSDMVLLEKFKAHDRVQYDPKTDLFSYKVCCKALLMKGRTDKLYSTISLLETRPPC